VFGRIVLVPSGWVGSLSDSFLPGAGMTGMRAGSRGSQTFLFRMIVAAQALGVGMLGGV